MRRALVVLGLVGLAACSRNNNGAPGKDPDVQDRAGTTRLTGASWVASDSAIERIVAARCAREVACSDLNPDKHFTTSDKCVGEVTAKLREDLTSDRCASGIDGEALDRCLSAIKTESCTNPIDSIARANDCRAGNLCPSSPHH